MKTFRTYADLSGTYSKSGYVSINCTEHKVETCVEKIKRFDELKAGLLHFSDQFSGCNYLPSVFKVFFSLLSCVQVNDCYATIRLDCLAQVAHEFNWFL